MTSASAEATTSAPSDPTMTRLAPQPSRRRNLMLVVVGFFALAAAAASPVVMRPSVLDASRDSGGSWSALPTHRQIVTTIHLATSNWPGVTVRSIDDVRGASVDRAWLIDEATFASMNGSLSEDAFDSGVDYLRAMMPTLDVADDALPQRLDKDESAYLVVLWNVDDCGALGSVPPEAALLELGTIIHTSHHQTLPEIATPGFFPDTLRTSGICT